MYCIRKLSLVLLLLSKLCLGWNLPPVNFLSEFAKRNDRTQLSISVPFGIPSMNRYFGQLTRENEMPTSFTFIEEIGPNINMSKNPRDLIVFVPDESDIDSHIEKFIEGFSQRERTNTEYWLLDITSLSKIKAETKDRLDNLKLDFDDDLFWFAYSNKGIELYEAYRIHEDFGITVKPYGSWSIDNGLTLPMHNKWIRRKDMQGAKLKVMNEVYPPYVNEMIPTGIPGEFTMKGMYADLFHALQSVLNFTYVLKESPDGQWGVLKSDGTWTGMIRELQEQRTDIVPTCFGVSIARSKAVTFSYTIEEAFNTLFLKNPSGTFNFKAYFDPLHSMAWIFVGLFCIIASLPLFATSRFGPELFKDEFTWGKSQIFILSAVTMRGWSVSPSSTSSRCAFIVIMFAGVLIFYHWEAMLVSYLSTRFTILPFKDINGLMMTNYRIGIKVGAIQQDYFKLSTDPIMQKAYSERIEPYMDEYPASYDEFISLLLRDETLALYGPYTEVSYTPFYKNCEIIGTPAKYGIRHVSFGYQKYSPYRGIFDHYLREMKEKGALKRIFSKYKKGGQVCPDLSGKALGFESCFTAFLFLLSGVALGILIFFLENIFKFMYKFGHIKSPFKSPLFSKRNSKADDINEY